MKRFIQITAGKGPEECCFVVSQVLKKMIKECKEFNCYHEVIHREKTANNGNLRSASLWVDTKNHSEILLDWIGSIQWIGQSPFRPQHKRKNWFVGVFEIERNVIGTLDMNEVKFESFRSSGPGGQNVNKVSSAVRATHSPSGISVKVMDTRSQMQNKRLAKERIEQKWHEVQLERIKHSQSVSWENHLLLERGNPVKVFRKQEFKVDKAPKKFRTKRTSEKQKWKRDFLTDK